MIETLMLFNRPTSILLIVVPLLTGCAAEAQDAVGDNAIDLQPSATIFANEPQEIKSLVHRLTYFKQLVWNGIKGKTDLAIAWQEFMDLNRHDLLYKLARCEEAHLRCLALRGMKELKSPRRFEIAKQLLVSIGSGIEKGSGSLYHPYIVANDADLVLQEMRNPQERDQLLRRALENKSAKPNYRMYLLKLRPEDPNALPLLLSFVKDDDWALRESAIASLRKRHEPAAREAFWNAFNDPFPENRRLTCLLAVGHEDPEIALVKIKEWISSETDEKNLETGRRAIERLNQKLRGDGRE